MQPYLPPYDDQFIPLSGSVRVGTDSFGQPIWEMPGRGTPLTTQAKRELWKLIDEYASIKSHIGARFESLQYIRHIESAVKRTHEDIERQEEHARECAARIDAALDGLAQYE